MANIHGETLYEPGLQGTPGARRISAHFRDLQIPEAASPEFHAEVRELVVMHEEEWHFCFTWAAQAA